MSIRTPLSAERTSLPFTASEALDVAKVCSVGGLLGESTAMQQLFERIARVANTHATILMVGENGSGKELTARCIHQMSTRCEQPFLVLNCGSLPPALMETELFGREAGHHEGALTHLSAEEGYIERAGSGTLLLEDVPELSPDLQLKLLRLLESGRLLRVGGELESVVHCRVIATMQRDTDASRLRPELFDFLSICVVPVPPLREREDDAELLASYFLNVLNTEEGTAKLFTPQSMECIQQYPWPGNVRELRNAVHRAFVMAERDVDLCAALERNTVLSAPSDGQILRIPVGTPLEDVERWMIMATLRKCEGNKTRAAALLGVSLKTLYNRLNAYRAQGFDLSDTDRQLIEVAN
jgi:DNA-binding NtrC family response regulator